MRVVGGKLGGTPLRAPKGRNTRPTSDRTREALFSILTAENALAGARVLDLFAGTGALGLEALSRGSAFCLFIETDMSTRGFNRRNCEACDMLGQTKIWQRDATRPGARPASMGAAFSLAFVDPPYGKQLAARALAQLRDGNWLTDDALLVVEDDKRAAFTTPAGYAVRDRRQYSDTELIFLTLDG